MAAQCSPVDTYNPEDTGIPGVQLVMTDAMVGRFGLFEEDALDDEDAWESNRLIAEIFGLSQDPIE